MSAVAPAIEEVRAEAAAWFAANWDPALTLGEWWQRLGGAGWGYPTWPVGRCGRGLSNEAASAVAEERRRVGAFGAPAGIASMLAGPTLLAHGTADQLDRFLPGIVSGEHIWCQLFSEPSAGSDLASLRTRAERDGDRWVVNGQKVWTSGAHKASYGILIARTDPDAPKHRGISYFVIDMRQPGVEVRPLKEMTGRAVFNEVFFTDAVVPAENLIGDLHDGWRVALTTLANERNGLGANASGGGGKLDIPDQDLSVTLGDLLAVASAVADEASSKTRGFGLVAEIARQRGLLGDPVVRQELMRNYIAGEVARISGLRIAAAAEAARRGDPRAGQAAPIVSVQKMAASQNLHRLGRAALDLQGPYGMLGGPDALADDRAFETVATAFMISIGGGTDQIQRNIVGERVLGLPGEPRTDKDVSFRDLPADGSAR
ncbi:MAG: acyl-CoA dehydrogenase family protein [Acidimicrobiia bacterium]